MSFYTRSGRKVRMNRRYQDSLFDTQMPRIQPNDVVVPTTAPHIKDEYNLLEPSTDFNRPNNVMFQRVCMLAVALSLIYYLDMFIARHINIIGHIQKEYLALAPVIYPWEPKQMITMLLNRVYYVFNQTKPLALPLP